MDDAFTFKVPADWPTWPHIYEATVFSPTVSKFGLSVPVTSLPEDIRHRVYFKEGRVLVSSKPRVPVLAPTDWLVRKLQELDAHNIRRDQVFAGRRLRVKAKALLAPLNFALSELVLRLIEVEILDHHD